jgi:thiamine biosynthesis lipoprotein
MGSRSSSVFLLFALSAFGAGGLERFEAVEPHMGTLVHIVIYAPDQTVARRAFQAAFARVAELDEILSDYKAESELSRLCATGSATVSVDLFRVLEASQRLAAESEGAFDITAAPMIRLWREARKTGILPDAPAIEAARARSGWRKLTLDARTRWATLSQAGMQLDVGGIAKGYVADETVQVLKQIGIRSALVAASGDIVVSDPPPGKAGWDLTLELLGGTRDIQLRNAAVSTAGDTEQFVEINGTHYSHIIDPATGMALTRRIAVSVIAPTGLEADGLDTTISVLGLDRGLALMKSHPKASALIVTEAGSVATQGKFREPASK